MVDSNSFGWLQNGGQRLVAPQLEYFRQNRWILEFAGLPDALSSDSTLGESLRLNCFKAKRPSIEFEDTKVERINGTNYLPGKPKVEPLVVSFYDSLPTFGADSNINPSALPAPSEVMEQWRELMWQPTAGDAFGSIGNFSAYAYLHMLAPILLTPNDGSTFDASGAQADASQAIVQSWLYTGLFPQKIDYGEGNYAESGAMEVGVTFRYQRCSRVAPVAVTV